MSKMSIITLFLLFGVILFLAFADDTHNRYKKDFEVYNNFAFVIVILVRAML